MEEVVVEDSKMEPPFSGFDHPEWPLMPPKKRFVWGRVKNPKKKAAPRKGHWGPKREPEFDRNKYWEKILQKVSQKQQMRLTAEASRHALYVIAPIIISTLSSLSATALCDCFRATTLAPLSVPIYPRILLPSHRRA